MFSEIKIIINIIFFEINWAGLYQIIRFGLVNAKTNLPVFPID